MSTPVEVWRRIVSVSISTIGLWVNYAKLVALVRFGIARRDSAPWVLAGEPT